MRGDGAGTGLGTPHQSGIGNLRLSLLREYSNGRSHQAGTPVAVPASREEYHFTVELKSRFGLILLW